MNITRKLKILALPLFQDNYSYILFGHSPLSLILIDPASPSIIHSFLLKYLPTYTPTHILYTHKHWDHAGGSDQLIQLLNNKKLQVIAGEQDAKHIKGVTKAIVGDEEIEVGGLRVGIMQVPCHTRGHVLYYFDTIGKEVVESQDVAEEKRVTEEGKEVTMYETKRCVFVGDTLFIGGAGNFFEGTAAQMNKNFQKIVSLPDDTQVFCGHQYTKSNLEWASQMDLENKELFDYKEQVKEKKVTIPSTVGLEKKINVFLRSLEPRGKMRELSEDPVELLRLLREMKSNKKVL